MKVTVFSIHSASKVVTGTGSVSSDEHALMSVLNFNSEVTNISWLDSSLEYISTIMQFTYNDTRLSRNTTEANEFLCIAGCLYINKYKLLHGFCCSFTATVTVRQPGRFANPPPTSPHPTVTLQQPVRFANCLTMPFPPYLSHTQPVCPPGPFSLIVPYMPLQAMLDRASSSDDE